MRMAVLGRVQCAHRCNCRLREIGTYRRLAVFACALGLAQLEVAWRLLFLLIRVGITSATRAALAAIAVT